jgi:hypothetical protein
MGTIHPIPPMLPILPIPPIPPIERNDTAPPLAIPLDLRQDLTVRMKDNGKVQRVELGRHIVADPKICHGQPTYKGTRIMA